MGIIGFLVFGLIVGALARLIKPGKQNLSLVATLLLGVVGSLIGGVVAKFFGTGDFFELNILGAVVARARMLQDAERAWLQDRPRLTTVMRWLSAAWLLLLITTFVFAVAFGNWPTGSFLYLLAAVGSIGGEWWRRRNMRRAIQLNGG